MTDSRANSGQIRDDGPRRAALEAAGFFAPSARRLPQGAVVESGEWCRASAGTSTGFSWWSRSFVIFDARQSCGRMSSASAPAPPRESVTAIAKALGISRATPWYRHIA